MSYVSVEMSNKIGGAVLNIGLYSGGVGLAAAALQSPIGFLGGVGAGVVYSVSSLAISSVVDPLLNVERAQASNEVKMLATLSRITGALVATWASLAMWGSSLTVGSLVGMFFLGVLFTIPVAIALACLNIHNIHTLQSEERYFDWRPYA